MRKEKFLIISKVMYFHQKIQHLIQDSLQPPIEHTIQHTIHQYFIHLNKEVGEG